MMEPNTISETEVAGIVNWKIGNTLEVLNSIHTKDVNIAIYERDVEALADEISYLIEQNISFRSSGTVDNIIDDLLGGLDQDRCVNIATDVKVLLQKFAAVTKADEFRIMLATINNNMCRKFHTDINDLRLLCTYRGPGTLWLTDDNINKKALDAFGDNHSIALDERKIRQATTGDVVILKGAIYPAAAVQAVVHRSPTIEESGIKRLLLRIDTNATMKLWT